MVLKTIMTPGNLLRPRRFPPPPEAREKIYEIEAVLINDLGDVERRMLELTERRHDLIRELTRCRDALGGAASPLSGHTPFPNELAPSDAVRLDIQGRQLREVAARVLRAAPWPITLAELRRSIELLGFEVPDPPSMRLSNALRPEIACGSVVRYGRGLLGPPGVPHSRLWASMFATMTRANPHADGFAIA
ncbi:MAG TPA: hypothetical protein VEJ87_05915 [Acidimicrobiales bacterium]|nr:hypothetical protein [Acidimicrobiales bacterium]